MTHELTPFQQSLIDAARVWANAAFDTGKAYNMPRGFSKGTSDNLEEAKAKFRALVEKAVEDKELEWYRNQINKLSRGPFYEY